MTAASRPDHWDQPVTVPDVALRPDRIMVGFDGSLVAEQALGYAATLALDGRSEVVIVVAYDPPVAGRRLAGRMLTQTQAALSEEAQALATEAVAALHDRGVEARGVVVEGNIAGALLDTAQAEAADLIVLGRSGMSSEVRSRRLADLLHGGVAQRVAFNAPVPVLVVG